MQKNTSSITLCSILFSLLSASPAGAATKPIGMIIVIKGEVQLTNSGNENEKAKVGLQIFEGDKITSAASSTAKIVTVDRNVLVIGENSEMLIERYSHDEANKKQVDIKLTQGSLRSALEQTYANQEEHFKVETPIAVAGVRGTDFLTEYHPATKESIVCTFKGQVAYQAQAQGKSVGAESLVHAGDFIKHNSGQPPQMTPAKPEWIAKHMAAHEIKGDEQKMNIKPEPRAHEPKGEPKSEHSTPGAKDQSPPPAKETGKEKAGAKPLPPAPPPPPPPPRK